MNKIVKYLNYTQLITYMYVYSCMYVCNKVSQAALITCCTAMHEITVHEIMRGYILALYKHG